MSKLAPVSVIYRPMHFDKIRYLTFSHKFGLRIVFLSYQRTGAGCILMT